MVSLGSLLIVNSLPAAALSVVFSYPKCFKQPSLSIFTHTRWSKKSVVPLLMAAAAPDGG